MNQLHIRWKADSREANRFGAFLGDAYSDYISARTLLRAEMLVQGAGLASTAVEKYLKALIAFHGNESHGHLKRAHWNALRAFDPGFYAGIPSGFFELLVKCYKLRYSDSVPKGFNVVIAQRELLAEIDIVCISMQRMFKKSVNGVGQKFVFDTAVSVADARLLGENVMLSEVGKEEFIYMKPQLVCEVRRHFKNGVHYFSYYSEKPALRPGFLREAVVPTPNDPRSFALSHEPVDGTTLGDR
jgi:hypothetical protein